jgi:hypothetical protein
MSMIEYDEYDEYEYEIEIEYEAQSLLGCTAVFLIECRPTFQRYVLPPSSGRRALMKILSLL